MYLVVNSDEVPSVTVLDENQRKQLVGLGGWWGMKSEYGQSRVTYRGWWEWVEGRARGAHLTLKTLRKAAWVPENMRWKPPGKEGRIREWLRFQDESFCLCFSDVSCVLEFPGGGSRHLKEAGFGFCSRSGHGGDQTGELKCVSFWRRRTVVVKHTSFFNVYDILGGRLFISKIFKLSWLLY